MIIEVSIAAVISVAGYFERRRLVKLIDATESKAAADLLKAASELELAKAGVKAPDKVRQDFEGVINRIRADEGILKLHVYQLLTRVRTEVRKVL